MNWQRFARRGAACRQFDTCMPISPLACNLSRSKRVVKCSSQSRKQEAWEYGKLDLVYCKAPQYRVIHIFLFEIRALLGDCRDRPKDAGGGGLKPAASFIPLLSAELTKFGLDPPSQKWMVLLRCQLRLQFPTFSTPNCFLLNSAMAPRLCPKPPNPCPLFPA